MLKRTILLLMSDPLVRSVVCETLERAGYLVVPTGDLGSALDWLMQSNPDLLITRTYVSSLPGHEAASYLRKKRPAMRVLILGGLLDDDRLRNREALAGFEVFPKPYSGAQLLEKVREILDRSRPGFDASQ
jgi:DNA-binding response OmpR family regulator